MHYIYIYILWSGATTCCKLILHRFNSWMPNPEYGLQYIYSLHFPFPLVFPVHLRISFHSGSDKQHKQFATKRWKSILNVHMWQQKHVGLSGLFGKTEGHCHSTPGA